ncbi:hypothetical protein ES705_13673 [subsurface metagenome]
MSYPVDPELGWYYVVNVAGEVEGVHFSVGDWIIWNGTSWDKLAGKQADDAIGIQKNYFGLGIKGDIETRDYEISVENGDDFDMRGWFVANGCADTPNCIKRFQRSAPSSGSIGGSNHAVVVEHIHVASQVAHSHGVKRRSTQLTEDGATKYDVDVSGEFYDGLIDDKQPVITVESEGVSGEGLNMPGYIDSIPIIRMI